MVGMGTQRHEREGIGSFSVNLESPFITPDQLAELIRRAAPAHAVEEILRSQRRRRVNELGLGVDC